MMNTFKMTFRTILAVVLIFGLMVGSLSFAEKTEEEKKNTVEKTGDFTPDRYAILNINNLWAWQREDGLSNHSPLGDNGVYYPRGTAWAIYEDGIVWGSRAFLDAEGTTPAPFGQEIRVGGSTYGTGSRAGWVEGFGADAAPVGQDHELARMWRVRRDYMEMSDDDIIQDAADCYEKVTGDVSDSDIQTIMDDYDYCWNNWPTDLGAPFVDRDGDGVYTAPPPFNITADPNDPAYFGAADLITGGYDEPGIVGSDVNSPAHQVVFNTWNDLNKEVSTGQFGSNPTGLEVQSTIWGYKRADALGNIFFRRIRFINRGGVEIDANGNMGVYYLKDMYVCQWSDPDLGSSGDDLTGCDTTKSIGYIYNGNAIDLRYRDFNLPPPSAGYDFLQGPAVPSPGDVAIFDMQYKDDYKNLGMTGFSYFSAGSPYSDPGGGYDTNTIRWYKMLRGYAPLSGPDVRYAFPPGVEEGPFPLAGDPVAGTGHIDGAGTDYSFVPGDRRLLCISGPWDMQPGEVQEVVLALVCGLGADRLSSVSVMMFNDKFAQATYDALFAVPNAPPEPAVVVTPLDGEILLEWASDADNRKAIEETVNYPGGFTFEGYNVYQIPSPQSNLNEAVRLGTWDVANDVTTVLDEGFDQASGTILPKAVQLGTNSGISREFVFDRDYIGDIDKINNGTEYFLVVTAYSVATVPNYLPTSLESKLKVLRVIPQQRGPGEVYGTEYGTDVAIAHSGGSADASVYATVVDPDNILPASYTVAFDADNTWKVLKGGTVMLDGLTSLVRGSDRPIVDGIALEVVGGFAAPMDFTSLTVDGTGTYDIDSYYASGWSDDATAFDSRGVGTLDINLLQNDYELRFTGEYDAQVGTVVPIKDGTGSICTIYSAPSMADHPLNPNPGSGDRFTMRIPFEVWDIDRGIQVSLLVRDRLQAVDSDPWYAFNPAGRMYCWICAKPYDGQLLSEADEELLTWNLVFWETDWQNGDVVTIAYDNPLVPGVDQFTYNTAGLEITVDDALKEEDLERIGVFPNPYFAFNPLETNKLVRFVTFNNLPEQCTIRIFNLAGQFIKLIEKDDATQFAQWDLMNMMDYPIASGMYICHITTDYGEAILKLSVVMEAEILDVF